MEFCQMYEMVFRNRDSEAIEKLLVEIGAGKFYAALKNMHLPKPRQISSFYLECNVDCTFLIYKYPNGSRKIMKIDDYTLPEFGWRMIKVRP